jgi:hypothetical protein
MIHSRFIRDLFAVYLRFIRDLITILWKVLEIFIEKKRMFENILEGFRNFHKEDENVRERSRMF